MPDLKPNVTYPGVVQVEDWSYTCGWSVTPGRMLLTISPQDLGKIHGTGDLVATDGVNPPVPFLDCQVVGLQAPQGDQGPLLLTLDDGRWRWDFGAVSGRYKIPFDSSSTIPPLAAPLSPTGNPILPPQPPPKGEEVIRRIAKAPELAKMLLEGMKVKKYDLSGLDPNATPHVEWDAVNPALALAQLASDLGCVVAFNPSTLEVKIAKQGDGDGLPPGELQVAPQLQARPRPDILQCLGAYDRIQFKIVLVAVGRDFDGSYRPLSNLSYRPLDNDWTKIEPATFSGLPPSDALPGRYTREDAQALARETVYRYYAPLIEIDPAQDLADANDVNKPGRRNPVIAQIEKELDDLNHPKPPKVYGVQYRTKKTAIDKPSAAVVNFRLLPFKNDVTEDDTGRAATVPAKCYGRHSPPDLCRIGGSVLTVYDDTDETTEVMVPFSIHDVGNDDQLLVFAKQVYARKSDGKVYPAEIVVECACNIAVRSGQFYRSPWELKLPSGSGAATAAVVLPGGNLATRSTSLLTAAIVRDDVIFRRTARYEKTDGRPGNKFKSLEDNRDVVKPRAEYYLRGEARKYELVLSGDATYPGIRAMFPTGSWMQVTWDFKPTTRASLNTEHALYLPPFADRRRNEESQLTDRRLES